MKTLMDLYGDTLKWRRDSALTEQQWKRLTDEVVEVARSNSQMQQAIPVTPGDPGDIIVQHYVQGDYIEDSAIDLSGEPEAYERPILSKATNEIPVIHKEGEIPWREALSAQRLGRSLSTEEPRLLGGKVTYDLEKFLAVGSGAYKGITNTAGIQTQSGATWATLGNAYNNINTALGKLDTAGIPQSQAAILLNATQVGQVRTWNANGPTQEAPVRALLPGGIYQSPFVPAGEAYVYARDKQFIDRYVGWDVRTEPLPKINRNERYQVLTIQLPRVKNANAVVKITGIA